MLSAGYASESIITKKEREERNLLRIQGVLEGGPERLLLREMRAAAVMLFLLVFFSPSVFLLPERLTAEPEAATNLSCQSALVYL